MSSSVWKRVAVLVVVALLPVSAVAHTKLFYRMSCRSDYRKVKVIADTPEPVVTAEPTEIPLVEIPLESTLSPEPTLTPISTETPTEVPTEVPTPTVEIKSTEDTTEQITTSTDISTTPKDFL